MAQPSNIQFTETPLLTATNYNKLGQLGNVRLDSGAMHSFVHPRIVQTMEAQLSEGAVLTVTIANGSKLLCKDVRSLDLTFTAEGGVRQVTVLSQLYALDGL